MTFTEAILVWAVQVASKWPLFLQWSLQQGSYSFSTE